ncbi:MAG: hypothetical protein PHY56_01050 [Candidatus Omnitrophica bacterium]|jgi:hypothetical protein|nr:hypothetical protein [Candidatus Omnitrophota bacterium]
MRVFKHGNWEIPETPPCPICGTKKEGEVVLIPISGSNEEGSLNYEARQIHLECLDLMLLPKDQDGGATIIYQAFEEKGGK